MPERRPEAPAPPRGTVGDHAGFRLAVFAALLVVTLFAGYGLGRLTGTPAAADPAHPAPANPAGMSGMAADETRPHAHTPTSPAASSTAWGLAPSSSIFMPSSKPACAAALVICRRIGNCCSLT